MYVGYFLDKEHGLIHRLETMIQVKIVQNGG